MATWSREQPATHRLLSNNFNEARWKTAALKNAYALMGKRRFEYAASFFLLADHLQDAMNVLHNQLGDTQLAIAVGRVYGGDDSSILLNFLRDKILPQAVRDGNRWLATWAFWLLGKRDSAVRCLVTPLSTLLSPPETPNFKSKSYLTDDPALVVLYKQLREKSLQTLRGASMVGMQEEWEFVLHTAGLYERMGCDVLALDLGKHHSQNRFPSLLLPTFPLGVSFCERYLLTWCSQSNPGNSLRRHRPSSCKMVPYSAPPCCMRHSMHAARRKVPPTTTLTHGSFCEGEVRLLWRICRRESMLVAC